MKNTLKKAICCALTIAVVGSLVACSSSSTSTSSTDTTEEETTEATDEAEETTETSDGTTWKVGFALESMDVAVWNTMSEGMAAKAEELGVDYTCMTANNDVATQISNIENMITQGYNAIIIHSFDREAFADVVNEALAQGIVICAYDDEIIDAATGEPCEYQLTFLCDNYEIGYRVGKMACEWALETYPDEEEIQMGLLWHHEFEYQQDRVEGMYDAIAEFDPRITVVDEQEGLVVEDGVAAAEAWLQAYPDLKGVLATNDTCLLGFAEAWVAAGNDILDESFGM
ncbi:MAG: sugar ABC transporter substrate-binding protein [Lachnospiraceae bacterium]|nr:sugar ABC transporter substrate-binding protein [Lachnospiraceae bacterium]